MAFLHLWCRKHLKWPHWREGKKERRELWLKIVPWNVRLFFIFSITNLLYDVPWANWKLVAYLHTDIKVEVNFLLWGEKIGRWENLRLRPILSFPIQVWRQWLKGWDIGRCKIRRRTFLMRKPRAKCKSQSTLITGGVTTCRAGGGRGVRIFSCYSRMMLRTTTLIHTTVTGHSFIPSSSYGWYFL